jgi:hypothetical protein
MGEIVNERILNSVGRQNYDMYMLLTDGKEINSILDDYSSVYQMYNYRHKLLDKQVIDNIKITSNNLKQSLEQIFLDYLSDGSFKTVKNILVNHINGWNINRLLEIHKKYKYHRIFSLLTINYEDWLTI